MRRTLEPLLSQLPALALPAAATNKSPAISSKIPTEKIASTPTTKVANAQIEKAMRRRRRLVANDAAMPTSPIETNPIAHGTDCSIRSSPCEMMIAA